MSFKNLVEVNLAPGYGYALYPEDWITLNLEEACNSRYAFYCHPMNAEKYGVPPYFVYFSIVSYWDVPARNRECDRMDALIKKYSKACENAYLNSQIKEEWVSDEYGSNIWINRKEWAESFCPFHEGFTVVGSKLPYCGPNNIFVQVARIVRPKGYDYADEDRVAKVSAENEWKGIYHHR